MQAIHGSTFLSGTEPAEEIRHQNMSHNYTIKIGSQGEAATTISGGRSSRRN